MDNEELEPVAGFLVEAYLETASYSGFFRDQFRRPPTVAAKAHHLRSIVQSRIQDSDRYLLDGDYVEFGRVQFTDTDTGRTYLLRSASAFSIEQAKDRPSLFDSNRYLKSEVAMIVYSFDALALSLSVAGTRQRAFRKRLEASGQPVFINAWPYTIVSEPEPFDQEETDPFSDVGELDIDEEEGDGGEPSS